MAMITRGSRLGAAALMLATASLLHAQAPTGKAVPVTPDNFVRAETDMYFAQFAQRGGFAKFNHARDLPLGENTAGSGQTATRSTRWRCSTWMPGR
jgi:hypothetical protein